MQLEEAHAAAGTRGTQSPASLETATDSDKVDASTYGKVKTPTDCSGSKQKVEAVKYGLFHYDSLRETDSIVTLQTVWDEFTDSSSDSQLYRPGEEPYSDADCGHSAAADCRPSFHQYPANSQPYWTSFPSLESAPHRAATVTTPTEPSFVTASDKISGIKSRTKTVAVSNDWVAYVAMDSPNALRVYSRHTSEVCRWMCAESAKSGVTVAASLHASDLLTTTAANGKSVSTPLLRAIGTVDVNGSPVIDLKFSALQSELLCALHQNGAVDVYRVENWSPDSCIKSAKHFIQGPFPVFKAPAEMADNCIVDVIPLLSTSTSKKSNPKRFVGKTTRSAAATAAANGSEDAEDDVSSSGSSAAADVEEKEDASIDDVPLVSSRVSVFWHKWAQNALCVLSDRCLTVFHWKWAASGTSSKAREPHKMAMTGLNAMWTIKQHFKIDRTLMDPKSAPVKMALKAVTVKDTGFGFAHGESLVTKLPEVFSIPGNGIIGATMTYDRKYLLTLNGPLSKRFFVRGAQSGAELGKGGVSQTASKYRMMPYMCNMNLWKLPSPKMLAAAITGKPLKTKLSRIGAKGVCRKAFVPTEAMRPILMLEIDFARLSLLVRGSEPPDSTPRLSMCLDVQWLLTVESLARNMRRHVDKMTKKGVAASKSVLKSGGEIVDSRYLATSHKLYNYAECAVCVWRLTFYPMRHVQSATPLRFVQRLQIVTASVNDFMYDLNISPYSYPYIAMRCVHIGPSLESSAAAATSTLTAAAIGSGVDDEKLAFGGLAAVSKKSQQILNRLFLLQLDRRPKSRARLTGEWKQTLRSSLEPCLSGVYWLDFPANVPVVSMFVTGSPLANLSLALPLTTAATSGTALRNTLQHLWQKNRCFSVSWLNAATQCRSLHVLKGQSAVLSVSDLRRVQDTLEKAHKRLIPFEIIERYPQNMTFDFALPVRISTKLEAVVHTTSKSDEEKDQMSVVSAATATDSMPLKSRPSQEKLGSLASAMPMAAALKQGPVVVTPVHEFVAQHFDMERLPVVAATDAVKDLKKEKDSLAMRSTHDSRSIQSRRSEELEEEPSQVSTASGDVSAKAVKHAAIGVAAAEEEVATLSGGLKQQRRQQETDEDLALATATPKSRRLRNSSARVGDSGEMRLEEIVALPLPGMSSIVVGAVAEEDEAASDVAVPSMSVRSGAKHDISSILDRDDDDSLPELPNFTDEALATMQIVPPPVTSVVPASATGAGVGVPLATVSQANCIAITTSAPMVTMDSAVVSKLVGSLEATLKQEIRGALGKQQSLFEGFAVRLDRIEQTLDKMQSATQSPAAVSSSMETGSMVAAKGRSVSPRTGTGSGLGAVMTLSTAREAMQMEFANVVKFLAQMIQNMYAKRIIPAIDERIKETCAPIVAEATKANNGVAHKLQAVIDSTGFMQQLAELRSAIEHEFASATRLIMAFEKSSQSRTDKARDIVVNTIKARDSQMKKMAQEMHSLLAAVKKVEETRQSLEELKTTTLELRSEHSQLSSSTQKLHAAMSSVMKHYHAATESYKAKLAAATTPKAVTTEASATTTVAAASGLRTAKELKTSTRTSLSSAASSASVTGGGFSFGRRSSAVPSSVMVPPTIDRLTLEAEAAMQLQTPGRAHSLPTTTAPMAAGIGMYPEIAAGYGAYAGRRTPTRASDLMPAAVSGGAYVRAIDDLRSQLLRQQQYIGALTGTGAMPVSSSSMQSATSMVPMTASISVPTGVSAMTSTTPMAFKKRSATTSISETITPTKDELLQKVGNYMLRISPAAAELLKSVAASAFHVSHNWTTEDVKVLESAASQYLAGDTPQPFQCIVKLTEMGFGHCVIHVLERSDLWALYECGFARDDASNLFTVSWNFESVVCTYLCSVLRTPADARWQNIGAQQFCMILSWIVAILAHTEFGDSDFDGRELVKLIQEINGAVDMTLMFNSTLDASATVATMRDTLRKLLQHLARRWQKWSAAAQSE